MNAFCDVGLGSMPVTDAVVEGADAGTWRAASAAGGGSVDDSSTAAAAHDAPELEGLIFTLTGPPNHNSIRFKSEQNHKINTGQFKHRAGARSQRMVKHGPPPCFKKKWSRILVERVFQSLRTGLQRLRTQQEGRAAGCGFEAVGIWP